MIYIGSDHRGFQLKEELKKQLADLGYEYEDVGPFEYNKDDDYPDFAAAVGRRVALSLSKGRQAKGILICGSGVGVAVAANKIKGVIAGTVTDHQQVQAAVNDEDLNVIGLSADYSSRQKNMEIVKSFLEARFSGAERHIRRVNKIKQLED